MQKRTLPGTDLEVSQLIFGCWGITSDSHWGDRDEADSIAAIHAALDAGINFFDTAEMYGNGASEELLGKVFQGRDDVVIASKMRPDSMRPEDIPVACERTLKRLGVETLDLYQTHWITDVPAADTWGAILKLKEEGKIRHAGVCNMGLGHLGEVTTLAKPVTDQLPYNLLWRAIEHEILPHCRENDIGVLAYSPLMHGMLADKYKSAAEVPDGRARSRHFTTERSMARHGETGCEEETFAAIAEIRGICSEIGRSMADVALAWVAAQPGISGVIAGVRNADQLKENVATIANPLSADVIERLNAATDAVNKALGPNPDMWDGGANARYR